MTRSSSRPRTGSTASGSPARAAPHLLDEPLVAYRTGVPSMSADTARMETAVRAVVDSHASLYRREGVAPDWAAIHDSLLTAALLSGRRSAAERAVRSFLAGPTFRHAARIAMVAAAPRWYERRSAERRAAHVPSAWHDAARRWLGRRPVAGRS